MWEFYLAKYDKYKKWIHERRDEKIGWEKIKYGLRNNESELSEFLSQQRVNNLWDIDIIEWLELIEFERKIEEESINIEGGITTEGKNRQTVNVVERPGSCWYAYKKTLKEKSFSESSINAIKESSLKILSQLKLETKPDSPIKGLVVGNVQSGKTANMGALISMAADMGWNMFIILTGTIDSLRQQTETRLYSDLTKEKCNVSFNLLKNLKANSSHFSRLMDLRVENNRDKYLYVCLKNSTRLQDLLKWINKDGKKKSHLKILLIDDEADQAGINTANIKEEERKKINSLIISLVFNKPHTGIAIKDNYKAMNYIGYTATPYANILNESKKNSLYPHNFIAVLPSSNEYFGPQQIFGLEGTIHDGLPIVNNISFEDLSIIGDIHEGRNLRLPITLIESMMWFLCCVSVSRFWGRNKPISMLIHTSQRQNYHHNIYLAIKNFFETKEYGELIELCRTTYETQKDQFNLTKLRIFYPDYAIPNDDIKALPSFEQILPHLEELIKMKIQHIMMNDDKVLEYSSGVHLCVDNCQSNNVDYDGIHLRLVYPEEQQCDVISPAFIVIGGSTLSRGLTLEGLVSSYFIRPVGQADTLMQMGRWFGYRRGYELLPRIWLTNKTHEQFKFLSILDYELRKEICEMELNDISPAEYGPRVLTHPRTTFIRVTARNRMQSSEMVDVDYSGTSHQTVVFYKEKNILENNLRATENFINFLGHDDNRNPDAKNCRVFRNVDSNIITEYLKKLKYPEQSQVFGDMDSIVTWIEKFNSKGQFDKWNVILAGLNSGKEYKFNNVSIYKVNRTQKKKVSINDTINIGVLRAPRDEFADLDINNSTEEKKLEYKNAKQSNHRLRKLFNLEKTPQLFIYIIDKDSKASNNDKQKNREDLNAEEDLVGIWINIPHNDSKQRFTTKLRIKLDNNMNEGDIIE